MQSKDLQNCPRTVDCAAVEVRGQFWRPEDCIFPRDPEEKGGFLTLYPGFDGSETGASWEYCFSRCPGFVTNRGDLDSTVFQDTPVYKPGYLGKQYCQDHPCWWHPGEDAVLQTGTKPAKPGYNQGGIMREGSFNSRNLWPYLFWQYNAHSPCSSWAPTWRTGEWCRSRGRTSRSPCAPTRWDYLLQNTVETVYRVTGYRVNPRYFKNLGRAYLILE